jgi:hypothetical protein
MRIRAAALVASIALTLVGWGTPRAHEGQRGGLGGDVFLETTRSNHLVAVDPRSGGWRELRVALNCGDAEFCLVASGRAIVIGSPGRTRVYHPAARGRPTTRRIGGGWITFPSVTAGRVWLGLLDHSTPQRLRRRELRDVREETTSGKVTRDVGRPPGGRWPVGAVGSGLLFQGRHALRLWNPATRRVTRRFPGAFPVDTEGDVVAHCGEPCPRYFLSDTASGRTAHVKPPPGYSFRAGYEGAFSPDGSLLAVPVVADGHGHGARWSVALIDPKKQSATVVPGPRLDSVYQAMTWSSAGVLYFAGANGTVIAYRPGEARATLVARPGLGRQGAIVHMAAL